MRRCVAVLGCLWLVAGCESVTSESIQQWRNTEKGPAKLEAAFKDPKIAPRLRAEAAVALGDIGKGEVVETTLGAMAPADRAALLGALVPLHVEVLQKGTVPQARDARDGLFTLRAHASAEDQARIDAALLPAIAKELKAGRSAGGRHSIDKMLATIGPAAGPMLLGLLEDPAAPVGPIPSIVEILAKVADQPTRDKAGAALVKRVAALKGDIPVSLWRSLGQTGGPAVSEFLRGKVENGGEGEGIAAAQALQQGRPDPALVPFALRVAGNPKASKAVRDEMFGLLEHVGGNEARDGVVRIIGTDSEDLVRYRAYEAALAIGKGDAVVPALEAFPAKTSYKREDVVDFLAKDIQKLGPAAAPAARNALKSSSPVARLTGVLALEAVGGPGDVATLKALAGDKAFLKGFPSGVTVGKEAARVAEGLAKKGSGGKQ